jgi:UDP-N-acetylmuramoylalanine--D-glutamate ligase
VIFYLKKSILTKTKKSYINLTEDGFNMPGIDDFFSKLKDKKILIQGLGLNGGGVGCARFFLENGFAVKITDMKNAGDLEKSIEDLKEYEDKITYVLGEHREADFVGSDIVVKGPGVSPSNKFIQAARSNGAEIISDIEIFMKIAKGNIYALTGSKGKSSTVSAIYNIFKTQSQNSFLGGNITISPLGFYRKLDDKSNVILELSSWQLRDLKDKNVRFKGAGITNLLNDHQNYYSGMEDYLADKSVIAENQETSDFFIIPFADRYINPGNVRTKARTYKIALNDNNADLYYENGNAVFADGGRKTVLFGAGDVKICGEHNMYNLLFAAGFCHLAGIDPETIAEGIGSFKGAPYRLELVREWNGIKFINDTTATIPDAAISALKSFKEPVIWIGGGSDKNLDFSAISEVSSIPKHIFLLKGDGTEKMKKYLGRNDINEDESLENILEKAVNMAHNGDIILLSPGCTSFGLFRNEFHRGEVFNEFVRNLK